MSLRYDLEERLGAVLGYRGESQGRASKPSTFKVSEYIAEESVKQLVVSLSNTQLSLFQTALAEYDACSIDAKKNLASWLDQSVLQSAGRDMDGIDGTLVVHAYEVYEGMILDMVDRISTDPRNAGSMARHAGLNPVEKNSSCPLHPYGRVVMFCECSRPLARYIPVVPEYEAGCQCVSGSRGFVNPGHTIHDHTVYVIAPHTVGRDGLCLGVPSVDAEMSFFRDNLAMYAKLARLVFSATDNLYVAREVAGGPFSGYLQLAVMLAFKLSMSDVFRTVHHRHTDVFKDDVIDGDDVTRFARLVVTLRTQGYYRGWMNNAVQNAKRVSLGQPVLSDQSYKQIVHGVEEPVKDFRSSDCEPCVIVPCAINKTLIKYCSADEKTAVRNVVALIGDVATYRSRMERFSQLVQGELTDYASMYDALVAYNSRTVASLRVRFVTSKGSPLSEINVKSVRSWTSSSQLLVRILRAEGIENPSAHAVVLLYNALYVADANVSPGDQLAYDKRMASQLALHMPVTAAKTAVDRRVTVTKSVTPLSQAVPSGMTRELALKLTLERLEKLPDSQRGPASLRGTDGLTAAERQSFNNRMEELDIPYAVRVQPTVEPDPRLAVRNAIAERDKKSRSFSSWLGFETA